jgi:lysozyme
MNYSDLVDQLIRHEGRRLFPYTDSVGKTTIGVGRNLDDVGISEEEARYLLDHDIDGAVADLTSSFPWFSALDDVRQRVMIDMRFNLGPTRFRGFKRMLRMMAEGNYVQAAASMRDSLWYRQVKGRGVRLVQMMLTGKDVP